MRNTSLVDQMIKRFDKLLKACPVTGNANAALRPPPSLPEEKLSTPLSETDQAQSSALMRINHTGEVAAQALYLSQWLVARDDVMAEELYQAALEERDHLYWCKTRLEELNSRPSLLNPFFAIGAFGIGLAAGLCGDKISLGFLEETEKQVTAHLEKHLNEISPDDLKSRAILEQMKKEESEHATKARIKGGVALPETIRHLMTLASRLMTETTRYL